LRPEAARIGLAALVPRLRVHLIRFHGVLAPNARLRPDIIPSFGRQAGNLPVPVIAAIEHSPVIAKILVCLFSMIFIYCCLDVVGR
jgi:hypothetical protein